MWIIEYLFYWFSSALVAYVIFFIFSHKFQHFLLILKLKNIPQSLDIFEISDKETCQKACGSLKSHCQDLPVLGFHCEWVTKTMNGSRIPIPLLQLSSVRGLCCLFRLNVLGYVPPDLVQLLSDNEIIKVGVAPINFSKLLLKDYNIQVCGALDLRHLYCQSGGLAFLAKTVIGIKLDKNVHLRRSDWTTTKLTKAQKIYAATDVLVAIEVFKKWLLANSKFPPLVIKARQYGEFFNEEVKAGISSYLDQEYYLPSKLRKINDNKNFKTKKKLKNSYTTRKSPLYHNCYMYAPDGELLCSCDKGQAEWYVEKGLAEVVAENPFSIRLSFEPAARAQNSDERFYRQLKENCCVVCGVRHKLLKHNVVPREYRKHFPNVMKDHQSHDIVLMCVKCHQLASQHNEKLKKELILMCVEPTQTNEKSISTQNIRKSSDILQSPESIVPAKAVLEKNYKECYKADEHTEDVSKKVSCLETKQQKKKQQHKIPGSVIVHNFEHKYGELLTLERKWREHFLKTMKPQYLPAMWSVTHNHSRLSEMLCVKQINEEKDLGCNDS